MTLPSVFLNYFEETCLRDTLLILDQYITGCKHHIHCHYISFLKKGKRAILEKANAIVCETNHGIFSNSGTKSVIIKKCL